MAWWSLTCNSAVAVAGPGAEPPAAVDVETGPKPRVRV